MDICKYREEGQKRELNSLNEQIWNTVHLLIILKDFSGLTCLEDLKPDLHRAVAI